jgi:hypothetical protein
MGSINCPEKPLPLGGPRTLDGRPYRQSNTPTSLLALCMTSVDSGDR